MANEFDNKPRSAFEEAMQRAANGELSSLPDHFIAADTLNIANENTSFLDGLAEAADSVPKFISASLISGANQIYNIPASVGNLFGGDFEISDTSDVIAEVDSDLGMFYQEHKQGADLVGFLISSLPVGIGGIKILNAGQTALRTAIGKGKFGTGMGKALELLVPQTEKLTKAAIAEVKTNGSAASLLHSNSLKALGAGAGQRFLETLFFETAVTATMYDSPVLENQDLGDFVANVAIGTGLVGIIGGAIDATKLSKSLKLAADEAAIEARPYTYIADAVESTDVSTKILLDYTQIDAIPPVAKELDEARQLVLKNSAKTKTTTLDNRIRKNFGELSAGDQDVAEAMYQGFKGSTLETQHESMRGLVEVSKLGATSKIASQFERLQQKVIDGKASVAEIDLFSQTDIAIFYTKTWGEGAGDLVFGTKPTVTALSDTLTKGQRIQVTPGFVKAGSRKFNFPIKGNVTGSLDKNLTSMWDTAKLDPLTAQARYAWAMKLPTLKATAKKPFFVQVTDIPLMEKVLNDIPLEDMQHVRFLGAAQGEVIPSKLKDYIASTKLKIANDLLTPAQGAKALAQDEIAAVVNVKSSLLSGEQVTNQTSRYADSDIFALQDHAVKYTEILRKQGSRIPEGELVDIWNVPQHVKLAYNTKAFAGIDNNIISNLVHIKQVQKVIQQDTARAVASALGPLAEQLPEINSGHVFSGAKPSGASAGLVGTNNANYGTLASLVTQTGQVVSRMTNRARLAATETLDPLLYKLGTNQEATIEFSVLQARLRNIPGNYGLNEAGDALEPIALVRWKKAAAEAASKGEAVPKQPVLKPDMPAEIPLVNREVQDLVKAHIEMNGRRTSELASIRTAQGLEYSRSPDIFYPIPVNPRDYPHFAMVIDESVTSGNHSKTLYATSAAELDNMIHKLKSNSHLTVLTKTEAEEYYAARGRFEYEKTLSDNYLDTAMHRAGVSATALPPTDPKKVINEFLSWHLDREDGLIREAVSAKYEVQFAELENLGKEFTNVASSKFGNLSLLKYQNSAANNPFGEYIDTALAKKPTAKYPWWIKTNRMADDAVSFVLDKAHTLLTKAKTDAEIAQINSLLEKHGYSGAKYDAEMDLFANATPAKGYLSAIVGKANSILATIALRLDALNAVNNAVSANVLLGVETSSVIRAIERGDVAGTGALAELNTLAKLKVPGTNKLILSPTKLISNAVRKFRPSSPELQWHREHGFITSISDQYQNSLDALTFKGVSVNSWKQEVDKLHDKIVELANTGEKITGNKLAEEFNRYVAADVMKQLTDVAVKHGFLPEKEALSYINTFVNRTQGNYLSAQRPMLFAGPIGQSIGLFQTYQFNLMQQLLRYAGEGKGKDVATLLGLQGTIHGMNGLPAFNAINTHIVGSASGNKEHTDAYSAVYGTVGKEAGDWLMYGVASNVLGLLDPELKINLYTRGDINPRHLTIVPTDASQVPIVQASYKVFGNILNTMGQIAAGGDVSNTLLYGMEHNGISRPLAGLAQALKGLDNPLAASYSTSGKGNVIASNDLISLANLGRIAGGKPLDEAVALDAMFRQKAYAAKDQMKREVLGAKIKSTIVAGDVPTTEQMNTFMEEYAKAGGKQKQFNKWFTQLYKTANTSQINKMKADLGSSYGRSMQTIMGGRDIRDFEELTKSTLVPENVEITE